MRENRTPGSVRGQLGNWLSYRDDQLGNTITTLVKQQSNAQTWTPYEFDLSLYAGRTFYLYFGVYNNGTGNVTAMYVDDVSLQVCPAP